MQIELTGILGVDLATVAGREQTRARLIEVATAQIDGWLASVVVKEGT